MNNKKLMSDIARLICDMLVEYYKTPTDKEIHTGIVLEFQSYGYFLRHYPHFYALIIEGGFNKDGNFVHIPITDLKNMNEYFKKLVIKYFEDSKLFSP